ncbi:MAG: thiol-disulfide oxidoreductase DCC family protein [Anaerolineae bacterium]|jgi:predicted DCC family thiol-disulfide oxidoreductase YuxK|nr:thiol-disulfide oxidoreductase DCC family protein [Anaerolineae bacterium]MBT7484334.1 thiol-disulfide oxidoreductase DCC family protein [Candidatus Peregrinibacteria bacterium]MBT4308850.1 thiol-disulfide oxidoreductase DCC family protein [Anaerolineae bacterium]MBT4457219.1 thiol-disulfide oxidoreductase DCC family protein [Anaerolineae bacterium]MBT4841930.1 thiol-disulfide oxidoreductase DCC family protein [Anaerolineae bacterium]
MKNRYIVIFDGICNFCNGSVNFIIKRDPKGVFSFAPMQSEIAQELMQKHKIEKEELDTFLLFKNGSVYDRSDAALEITRNLTGFWHLFQIFKILPKAIRDGLYNLFARNRYALFGKRDSCMIPTPEIRKRFIE